MNDMLVTICTLKQIIRLFFFFLNIVYHVLIQCQHDRKVTSNKKKNMGLKDIVFCWDY